MSHPMRTDERAPNEPTKSSQPPPTAAQPPAPMAAAKPPVGIGPAPAIGIGLSLVVAALGVLGIHDGLAAAGWVDGKPWIDQVVELVDGWRPEVWPVPVGIALVMLGLWLLLAALRPRPRTAVAVRAETGVFLRPNDVERLAVRAANDVDGVISARSSAARRKVEVRVAVTGGSATGDRVRAAVEEALAPLETPPRIEVKVAGTGRSS